MIHVRLPLHPCVVGFEAFIRCGSLWACVGSSTVAHSCDFSLSRGLPSKHLFSKRNCSWKINQDQMWVKPSTCSEVFLQ